MNVSESAWSAAAGAPGVGSEAAGEPVDERVPGPRLIVGLGNPGPRYAATRHNVGFHVVAEVAARRGLQLDQEECNAEVAAGGDLLLALPQTYMNRSGFAVRCLLERRRLAASEVLVVYDDIHLPLGRLRLRPRGGPGGHRGMESVIENLRTQEVARLRCGVVGAGEVVPPEALAEFVLEPFAPSQEPEVEEMVRQAADACEAWLDEGIEAAMNRFNR